MKELNLYLISALSVALSLYSLEVSAQSTYVFREMISVGQGDLPFKLGTKLFSYTGTLQQYTVPEGATYALVTVSGAGAGGSTDGGIGGNGDKLIGKVPVYSGEDLNIVVGGGSLSGSNRTIGGAGLTGVFDGTPSQNSALLVAGGGGGPSSALYGGEPASSLNGGNASLDPVPGRDIAANGPLIGYGEGGIGGGVNGTPFGAGGHYADGAYATSGGFGGGASGGSSGFGDGGGGGGGIPGGRGGYFEGSGEGGTSFIGPSVTNVKESTGGAGVTYAPGRFGTNGYAKLTFYSNP